MKRRYYLATSLPRLAEAQQVATALDERGWLRTYDWGVHRGPTPPELRTEVAKLEVEGVLAADVLLVLLPGGRGTHVELGVALGRGTGVVMHVADDMLLLEPYWCLFYSHPLCRRLVGGSSLERLDDIESAMRFYVMQARQRAW